MPAPNIRVHRSAWFWLAALILAAGIHLDWHLGRPGHHANLSFHLPYHWLLALPVFSGLWLLVRWRWPDSPWKTAGLVILVGILLGQGLEPLGEVIASAGRHQPFAQAVRWKVFGEFILAGLVTIPLAATLVRGRRSPTKGSETHR